MPLPGGFDKPENCEVISIYLHFVDILVLAQGIFNFKERLIKYAVLLIMYFPPILCKEDADAFNYNFLWNRNRRPRYRT